MTNNSKLTPQEVWRNYKALELWKRVLLIVPVLIAIALVGIWFFMKTDDIDIVDVLIEEKDKDTKEKVARSEEKVKETREEEKKLEEERDQIKEEVKENAKVSKDIDNAIDSTDDVYELELIRKEIAERIRKNNS